jgi:hypothetical protein
MLTGNLLYKFCMQYMCQILPIPTVTGCPCGGAYGTATAPLQVLLSTGSVYTQGVTCTSKLVTRNYLDCYNSSRLLCSNGKFRSLANDFVPEVSLYSSTYFVLILNLYLKTYLICQSLLRRIPKFQLKKSTAQEPSNLFLVIFLR